MTPAQATWLQNDKVVKQRDKIATLRADLARVTGERDKLQAVVDEICAVEDLQKRIDTEQSWREHTLTGDESELYRRKPIAWSAAMALRTPVVGKEKS